MCVYCNFGKNNLGADDSSAGKGHSGGDLMVAFSFDTTGSMYDCLDEVCWQYTF